MIKIISDSSTLYTVSEAKDKGFYSVPLHVTIGDDSYRDLEDINSEQLLKMIEDGAIPKTSQPSIGEKIALYDELSKDNEVIDVTMAGGLSGTYQAALTAKNTCERPDKIHVIDSMTLCGPHRYMVDLALQMAKEKKSVKEIINFFKGRILTQVIQMFIMYFFVTLLKLDSNFWILFFTLVCQIMQVVLNYIISKLLVFKKDK